MSIACFLQVAAEQAAREAEEAAERERMAALEAEKNQKAGGKGGKGKGKDAGGGKKSARSASPKKDKKDTATAVPSLTTPQPGARYFVQDHLHVLYACNLCAFAEEELTEEEKHRRAELGRAKTEFFAAMQEEGAFSSSCLLT